MVTQLRNGVLKKISFLRDLSDDELDQIAKLCGEQTYKAGELCQTEGHSANRVYFILEGRVGSVVRIANITYGGNDMVINTLHDGDVFGWSALIKGTPWGTLRVLEPTRVLYVDADELIKLCEQNYHLGYTLMRNLASLIASRLRRDRMVTLNTMVALRGEG